MMKSLQRLLGLALGVSLISCSTHTPNKASVQAEKAHVTAPKTENSAGQTAPAISATVKSVREVNVAGKTGAGGVAGTATGAVLGSSASRENPLNKMLGAIGGAIVGGIAGSEIEDSMTKKTVLEYVVETESGALMMIFQDKNTIFAAGDKVLVIDGAQPRLIAAPQTQK